MIMIGQFAYCLLLLCNHAFELYFRTHPYREKSEKRLKNPILYVQKIDHLKEIESESNILNQYLSLT